MLPSTTPSPEPSSGAAGVGRHLPDKFEAHAFTVAGYRVKQNMELDLRFPAVSLLAVFCSVPDDDKFPAGRWHSSLITY